MAGKRVPAALAALLCLGAAPPGEWTVDNEGIVTGTVNGVPAHLQIDPAALAMPVLTQKLAIRAGLAPGMMDFEYRIGPRTVIGQSAIGRIDLGRGGDRRRIGWAPQPWRAGLDGSVGPGMLDHPVIRFQLRPGRLSEQVTRFAMVDQGGLAGRWGARYAAIDLSGRRFRIQFDPLRTETIATAQAGAFIAARYGGRWLGPPRATTIAFGIARPIRRLALEVPLHIGPIALTSLYVRVQDFGSSESIREGPDDPNEIVVTGSRKGRAEYDLVQLGSDALQACSALVFDRGERQVRLHCKDAGS